MQPHTRCLTPVQPGFMLLVVITFLAPLCGALLLVIGKRRVPSRSRAEFGLFG